MSVFAAPTDVYYPKPENVLTGIGWGATDDPLLSVFYGGTRDAIIRSIFIPPTTVSSAPFPVMEILDSAGDPVYHLTLTYLVSGEQLLGPDGIKIPGGFSVEISAAAGGYVAITYDVA